MNTGKLWIVGIGPGKETLITPEVSHVLSQASDIIGYIPYLERIAPRAGLTLHASDNRVELERARHALDLAQAGQRVVVVSSGDPGVFAMAAAVFEAIENGPQEWRSLDISVLPGITAMLAASAALGAPLGHDFCTINLSDNLKPWSTIEKRLCLAIEGDFVIGVYNPRSRSRPKGFARTLDLLRTQCQSDRIIIFARAVSTPDEHIVISSIAQAVPEMADMRTLVIIGSSRTKTIERVGKSPIIYTPRHYFEAEGGSHTTKEGV